MIGPSSYVTISHEETQNATSSDAQHVCTCRPDSNRDKHCLTEAIPLTRSGHPEQRKPRSQTGACVIPEERGKVIQVLLK